MIIIVMVIIVMMLAAYQSITTVRYDHYRGRISSAYCHIAGTANIPKEPVIFVPGIKGSTLEENGKKVWLKLTQVLHNTTGLFYSRNGQAIHATGIFDRITLIPFFLEYRPYYRIAAQLACAPHGYLFWYDWRAHGQTNADAFAKLVDRVISETGEKPSVIAHSMGGLVAHSVVKEHPEKFNKIVYVTVPFNPGVGYMDDLTDGAPTGLNRTLMSKEAAFSQPSSFLLLPHKGTGRYRGKELMDANIWKQERLSVFADDAPVDMVAFQKTLDATIAYHAKLDALKTLPNKFLFIVGNKYPVIFGKKEDGTPSMVPGDGRVAEVAAFPTDTIPNKKIVVTAVKHGGQLNDKTAVNEIFNFLSHE